mmetsp:Transcript_6443/g.19033  ORF Transcript_6443/g.19033 Transcript_6443/m.19033 type:complete len:215 (+) Transcript_6443:2252-2896(+)
MVGARFLRIATLPRRNFCCRGEHNAVSFVLLQSLQRGDGLVRDWVRRCRVSFHFWSSNRAVGAEVTWPRHQRRSQQAHYVQPDGIRYHFSRPGLHLGWRLAVVRPDPLPTIAQLVLLVVDGHLWHMLLPSGRELVETQFHQDCHDSDGNDISLRYLLRFHHAPALQWAIGHDRRRQRRAFRRIHSGRFLRPIPRRQGMHWDRLSAHVAHFATHQ